MDITTIEECKTLSMEGSISFPEVVGRLLNAGVERYLIDLVGSKGLYYGTNNEFHLSDLKYRAANIPASFNASEVQGAIRAIQQGKIQYQEFLRLITAAGCSHYEAFLTGRKVVYIGRDGSQHIEHFPK